MVLVREQNVSEYSPVLQGRGTGRVDAAVGGVARCKVRHEKSLPHVVIHMSRTQTKTRKLPEKDIQGQNASKRGRKG